MRVPPIEGTDIEAPNRRVKMDEDYAPLAKRKKHQKDEIYYENFF
jgi:hypothetical protein